MLHAIVMAGGSGTRFWPWSRRRRPKQLLPLVGAQPILRATVERILPLVSGDRVWVVTGSETATAVRSLLPEVPAENVLAEPVGRDTAACAGYAAHAVLRLDPRAVCAMLPADHIIGQEERFRTAVAAGAAHVVERGGLLTFGIRPGRPETGYGYLELGSLESTVGDWSIHRLERFVEKPSLEVARRYVEEYDYLWNSGIFVWQAGELLDEVQRQLPALASGLERIAQALGGSDRDAALAEIYPRLPAISVDYGVMEGAANLWSIPVDFPWSDVGSWPALAELLSPDEGGNASRGRTVSVDSAGNLLFSDGPVVAVSGVDDLVIAATPDAVLVIPKEHAQRVKELVAKLEELGLDDVL
jgi:mannose-1-phosphate guanylyltransferase